MPTRSGQDVSNEGADICIGGQGYNARGGGNRGQAHGGRGGQRGQRGQFGGGRGGNRGQVRGGRGGGRGQNGKLQLKRLSSHPSLLVLLRNLLRHLCMEKTHVELEYIGREA